MEPKEGYLVIVAYGGRHVVHGSIYEPLTSEQAQSICYHCNLKASWPKSFPKVRAVIVKIELGEEGKR
jgi:hypothetical protein